MRPAAFRTSCLALALPFLAGCVTNPFLAGYKGERLAPVPEARVVAEEPAPGTAPKRKKDALARLYESAMERAREKEQARRARTFKDKDR